jgi:DNA polymerase-3 subunit alpha
MDPERNEMPDIDMDICQINRGKVLDYVRKKYGQVAQIVNFNTMAQRERFAMLGVCWIFAGPGGHDREKNPGGPKVTLKSALETEPISKNV